MAVGLPLKTTYVNGDVFSASDVNDITGTVNLVGQTNNFYAGKNRIINGDMGIWQRGTTFTAAANGSFSCDRWKYTFDGTGTATITRQTFTPGTAPVAGYEGTFFLRHTVTLAGTTTFAQMSQPIEDVRAFAGQTVTFSFWAKADAARSSFIYAEQNFGSGGSATVQYLSMGSASLTTAWQRFSFTVALSSVAGKTIGTNSFLTFYIRGGITLSAATDIWGVQLESGSTSTAFQTATGTIQGELAACQRYYWRNTVATTIPLTPLAGWATSATAIAIVINNPVPMRVTPTSLDYLGTYWAQRVTTNLDRVTTSLTLGTNGNNLISSLTGVVPTGLTTGNMGYLAAYNTNDYIGFSAEL